MRNLLLGALAALAFAAPSAAEDHHKTDAHATNAKCVCGMAVKKDAEQVTIKKGDKVAKVACCSKECAETVKKMKPEEAEKALQTMNQDWHL